MSAPDRPGGVRLSRVVAAILGTMLVLQAISCASGRYTDPRTGERQRGLASWYGDEFHGRPTASGEKFDMHELTAAHRELPLGTLVEVENLDNGRKVKVRINDRGPFVKGRILDLSYGAAKKLGMVETGVARVEIHVLEVGKGRSGTTRFTRWAVQVGAFRSLENAREVLAKVAAHESNAELVTAGGWHRVRIGPFATRGEAEDVRRELRKLGFEAIVKTASRSSP